MNIYEALTAVMRDCGAVGKDSKNPQQGYEYRGIDAVMNAVNPALTKNRVFVAPEVLEMTREERQTSKGTLLIYSVAKVKYTFYAEDGSSITAVVIGEGMDSGDKSMNKAMSAAFKYALFQVLCIPTEEMIDSEVDSPKPQPKRAQQKQTATQKQGAQQAAPASQQPAPQQEATVPQQPTPQQPPVAQRDPNEKITAKMALNLRMMCKRHYEMPEEKIYAMYGRNSLEDMTVADWVAFGQEGKGVLEEWDLQHQQQ